MEFPYSVLIKSPEETAQLANKFSSKLNPGEVVILNGTLGAGKTFFIKKAAAVYDIDTVNSPTFSIVNVYEGRIRINHFDFYRINSSSELINIGFDDYLAEDDSITFIEWGNLFPDILPEKRFEIDINLFKDDTREFIFNRHGK